MFSWANKTIAELCTLQLKANMVSHYLCNELNVFGPTTRADVDTWEGVQQRQAGCPGTGAQGIPGKLEELGFLILENRWLLGSHCCLQLPDGLRDKAEPESPLSCITKGLNSEWMWGIIPCHEGDQAQKSGRPCMSFPSAVENPTEKERPWAPWPTSDFGFALIRV